MGNPFGLQMAVIQTVMVNQSTIPPFKFDANIDLLLPEM